MPFLPLKNVKHSIRIMIACWALFGRAGLVIFCAVLCWVFGFAVLSVNHLNANTIHSAALSGWKMAAIIPSVSAVHKTVTLTHTHSCRPHTQTTYTNMCTDPKIHRHTVPQQLLTACLPHPLSFSHSFTPFWHRQMLSPPSAPLKETQPYMTIPFLHPQACVVVVLCCFHPFMPMKIGPIEWMEMVLFHSFKRRNSIRCENNSGRWGNTWLHSLSAFR